MQLQKGENSEVVGIISLVIRPLASRAIGVSGASTAPR